MCLPIIFSFFFFNDTATTEIYTLSLHDALPIYAFGHPFYNLGPTQFPMKKAYVYSVFPSLYQSWKISRSEEHTSELQSRLHLVCRLLLEKKKKQEQKESRRPARSCSI